jgi:hypothetical protein
VKTMTVTIHRPNTATDAYGNTNPTGTYAADRPVQALWVGRTRSQEYTEGRQTMTTSARAAFPPGTDVEETDEMTASGQRYRITGVLRQNRPTDPEREWLVTAELERAE